MSRQRRPTTRPTSRPTRAAAPRLVALVAATLVLAAAGCSASLRHAGVVLPPAPGTPPAPQARQHPVLSAAAARPLLRLRPTGAHQRPPQFIVASFDGAGGRPLWAHWRQVAAQAHAHLTFFLSGVYLLTPETRLRYSPPEHRPGTSDIGFGVVPTGADPREEVRALLDNLAGAWRDGNEIGTHFNGHFCAPYANNVGTWSTADWDIELDQFDSLLTRATSNVGLPAADALPFGPGAIQGARTPCLQGIPAQLHAAEVAHHERYDASYNALEGTWPYRTDGLWEMPLALVPVAGEHYRTLSTDYNLFANQSGAATGPAAQWPRWQAEARGTWQSMLDASYGGDRAPVIIGNHFEDWNGDAYTGSLTSFLEANCRKPEVRCVSFEELANWLDAEGRLAPGALASFQAGKFPHAGNQPLDDAS